MNNKTTSIFLAAASVVTLIAVVGWYHASSALHDSRSQFVGSTLEPMAALLSDDQTLINELQTDSFTEKDSGILESYLARIRRDGVPKNADMKQRLDQLEENNVEIVALIKAYVPYAKSSAFVREADKFRNYASAWRDRWNSVMEFFMAGGNFAASAVPFPKDFAEAVQVEIQTANR